MNKLLIPALALFSFVALAGCDKKVTEHQKTKEVQKDGTVVETEKKVTEGKNGDKKVVEEKSVDHP